MLNQNFSTLILVDESPKQVFDAINNVRGWWSEEIEGETSRLNDEFKYHYRDIHSCKMKLVELIPNKKVEWLVEENYFNFTKDKTEWIGNKISFEINKKNNKTEVLFTHLGLVPAYECYEICFDAWSKYIKGSLYSLITSGNGMPNPKENLLIG
jgi:predicted phosphohydrolase